MDRKDSGVPTTTMSKRKRVLITINPGLLVGKRFPTIRTLVSNLDERTDLLVAPVGQYDFESQKVRAYRRVKFGKFEDVGMITPAADLWIVYSDGYWLDAAALGFRKRIELYDSQNRLHQHHLDKRNVGMIANQPIVESRTLKGWLVNLAHSEGSVIPTVTLENVQQLHQLRESKQVIVAKLSWGGAMMGTTKLTSSEDVVRFAEDVEQSAPYISWNDYCFQDYISAPAEKRFYVAGGEVVGARLLFGRSAPWEKAGTERGYLYDEKTDGYVQDFKFVQKMLQDSGLIVGSIDFIGSLINEINGGGTVFTYIEGRELVLDFRQALVDSFINLLDRL
jgi:hypothetical protein